MSKNLAYPSNGSKWLCSAENRTGKCEVVLELSKKVRINHVDVGKWKGHCFSSTQRA